MEIKRKIRLFFSTYGESLFKIIGVILVIWLVIRLFNQMAVNNAKERKLQNELTYENQIENEKKNQLEVQEKKIIENFINYCNQKEIEKAYNMLSDTCKQENYPTMEEFKNKYINSVFNMYICDYKIVKNDDIYTVTLVEDMIATGKTNETKEQKYKLVGVLERKIEICE